MTLRMTCVMLVGLLLASTAFAQMTPQQVFDRLGRAGMVNVSIEPGQGYDAAFPVTGGTAPIADKLSSEASKMRRVFIANYREAENGQPSDLDLLHSVVARSYDKNWNVLSTEQPAEFANATKETICTQKLLTTYMSYWLRYVDLSNAQTNDGYVKARNDFLTFIKRHLAHRWATGIIPLYMKNDLAAVPLTEVFLEGIKEDYNGGKGRVNRDREYVQPTSLAKSKAPSNVSSWTVEFLFQKRSSWPDIDSQIIKKAGSEVTAKRYRDGNASFYGYWFSPVGWDGPAPQGWPSNETDKAESVWQELKDKGYYEVKQAASGGSCPIDDPSQYSVVWGPQDDDYYFDPGHNREDLAKLTGNINDPWYQYQCHVMVKSGGYVDGVQYGPYYYSDLFYIEMYSTKKTLPENLADARKLFEQRHGFTVSIPVKDDERVVVKPTTDTTLFRDNGEKLVPGLPDGKVEPKAYFPLENMNFKGQLPETYNDQASVYFKTGCDTNSLVRFPPKGTQVPETLPAEAKTPEGFRKFLNTYYTCYAVYYPPQTVNGNVMGPWLVNAESSGRALSQGMHTYYPTGQVPGANGVEWRDIVYKPIRFAGNLEQVVYYLYDSDDGVVKANYGTDKVPGGYKWALKGDTMGTVGGTCVLFDAPTQANGYELPAGAFPLPVGYQTMHGKCAYDEAPGKQFSAIAGADVNMWGKAEAGDVGNDITPETVCNDKRDNYMYSAATISAGCCGTVTTKLVDKSVGVAFQPRGTITVTLVDAQGKTQTDGKASVETLGVANNQTLGTGKPALPYDAMSLSSRTNPDPAVIKPYENNFATIAYNTSNPQQSGLITDVNNKPLLQNQLQYFANQQYTMQVAAECPTGPTVVNQDETGAPTTNPHIYYCAKVLTVEVLDANKNRIKQANLIPPALDKGPFKGLTTEPPMGTVLIEFPQPGEYEVVTTYTDCNDQTRSMTSKVKVDKKGFDPSLVGEERQKKD